MEIPERAFSSLVRCPQRSNVVQGNCGSQRGILCYKL